MRRLIAVAAFALAAAACDNDADGRLGWFSRGDGRVVAASAGDAELDAAGRLDFEVTSDVYRRWMQAQAALGRSDLARFVAQLGRRALTQEELDRAVERVQDDPRARAAIEGAGMTPIEYVHATVAIEQAMAVASGRLAPRRENAGVPRGNVEIVGRHQEEILRGGIIGDTTVIVLPDAPPPVESIPAMPPTNPQPPVPLPQPLPRSEPTPIRQPMPQPPSPQPDPDPAPPPDTTRRDPAPPPANAP